MVKTYLENRIVSALQDRGLIGEQKSPVIYRTERVGEDYRKGRKWVIDHIEKISVAGLLTAAGLAYNFPKIAAGVGVAVGAVIGAAAVSLARRKKKK